MEFVLNLVAKGLNLATLPAHGLDLLEVDLSSRRKVFRSERVTRSSLVGSMVKRVIRPSFKSSMVKPNFLNLSVLWLTE